MKIPPWVMRFVLDSSKINIKHLSMDSIKRSIRNAFGNQINIV
jgi:hypothetical protein